jgi:anaerobic selenocysteine-containing dehydrogenase
MSERISYRTCPLCEATCGLRIEVRGEVVVRVRGDLDDPLSKGFVCPKGTTLGRLHHDPDRLRLPLVRRDGELIETGWDEAFAEVDRRLAEVVTAHGSDAVAVYVGNPNAHNYESNLALRPFLKALRTRNLFSASTVDQMPKQVSCAYLFGHPFTTPVPDIDRTDHLLILGANPLESNGSLATAPDWPGRLKALVDRGARLEVVDPRRTRTAAMAHRHVPVRPGTDAALLAAMITVVAADGAVDPGRLGPHIDGLDRVVERLSAFTPERVAPVTGVHSETIVDMARRFATARSAVAYGRIGTHTTPFGTLAAWLVDVLNIATGNLDRPGGAMFAHAVHEPATRPSRGFRVGRWSSRVRGLPEVLGELPVATMIDEIETAGEGQVRVLFTVAGNPALTTPDAARLDEALEGLDLLVAVDPYVNATTRHADVILPPPSALERGHFDLAFQTLTLRNFADWSSPVFERPPGTPSEFEILVRLAGMASGLGADVDAGRLAEAALGEKVRAAVADPDSPIHGRDPGEILAALDGRPPEEQALDFTIRVGHRGDGFGARPGGLSLELLERHPHGIDLGPLEPRLPAGLATASGMIELAAEPLVSDLDRLEAALVERVEGMVLIGRRQVRTANSWTHNIEVLVKGKAACTAHVNPVDAERFGLEDGKTARFESEVGLVDVTVEVTDDVMPGVVSIPYGWGHGLEGTRQRVAAAHPGVNVNVLTTRTSLDPLSGNATLNGIPVSVSAV